jgi:hypothetical protein
MKESLAALVMIHDIAASVSALVSTGKDHGAVFYELLYSAMKEVV